MFPFYSICYILSDLGVAEFLDSQGFWTQLLLSCLPSLYDSNLPAQPSMTTIFSGVNLKRISTAGQVELPKIKYHPAHLATV